MIPAYGALGLCPAFSLTPLAVISGQVRYADGFPAGAWKVEAFLLKDETLLHTTLIV